MGSLIRSTVLVLALAACAPRPPPAVESVEPSEAWAGAVVDVVVHGRDLLPALKLDFDRPSRSTQSGAFSLRLGDVALENVEYVDLATLRARVPGTLAVGTWPLTVVDPAGREATLADAFTVRVEQLRLVVESAGAGVGSEVGDLTVRLGQSVSLHAVGRRSDGAFAKDVIDTSWTTTDGLLSDTVGHVVEYTPTVQGQAVVTATHLVYGSDSTGVITALACAGVADCSDACHTSAACTAGVCVLGPSDKDRDGDTFVDGVCPGGTDCNDAAASASPSGTEGPAGSPSCDDGLDNDCDGFADTTDPGCLATGNTPPVARIAVTPSSGVVGDLFSGDATGSSDAEDAPSALAYDWDWNGDGRYETTGARSSYRYRSGGTFEIALRVTDTQGATSIARATVVVTLPSTVTVTTPADESDANATPANPGGAGFSLREAIVWANLARGRQTIVVPAGTVIRLGATLPIITDEVSIDGNGAFIDGSGVSGAGASCVDVSGSDVSIDALEIFGCSGWPLYLHGSDARVTNCRIHDNRYNAQVEGSNNVFGPGNELWINQYAGVGVKGDNLVRDNVVHDNPRGIVVLRGGNSRVVGNRVYRNTGPGLELQSQADNAEVFFNTVHGNLGSGLATANNVSNLDLRDNLFTSNGGWGLDAAAAHFSRLDANDFFQNTSGACRACSSLGPKSLAVDPRYTDLAVFDFRPLTTSPVIDAAVDVNVDRNGSRSGDFDGAAPDMGAFEVR